MVPRKEQRIDIGTFGAPVGLAGGIRFYSLTQDPLAVFSYCPLLDAAGKAYDLILLRNPGKPRKSAYELIVGVKGFDNREAVEALRGLTLYAARAQLPEPERDEFYHADLLGLSAIDPHGAPIGTLAAIHNFGAGDMLEIALAPQTERAAVTQKTATILVPFQYAHVGAVDVDQGTIVISTPISEFL